MPSRVHRGSFYALPQSPQLFKQILMVAGFERYFQIARCFRDEDLRADRQPEFTQIDVEMSFIERGGRLRADRGALRADLPAGRASPLGVALPAPDLRRGDARYGSDRPDLRFGLEIADLTDLVGGERLPRLPRGGGRRRRRARLRRARRGRRLAQAGRRLGGDRAPLRRRRRAHPATREGGETRFQVKDALVGGRAGAAHRAAGPRGGRLALLAAGPAATTAAALGALRLELARHYGLIPADRHAFLWVTEFPLFEWSAADDALVRHPPPVHRPDPRDLELLESDPARCAPAPTTW